MKFLLTALCMSISFIVFSQTTINLTEDLVLTETLTITEDVTYNGNGFSIRCDNCKPAIKVKNGAKVHFENVKFPKTYARWLRVEGGRMADVTWNSSRMKGFIRSN